MASFDKELIKNKLKHTINILTSLNEAIEGIPRDKSVFFKAVAEHLEKIRDRFIEDLGLDQLIDEEKSPATVADRIAARSNLSEVYVHLYLAEGSNIHKWENLINTSLDRAITRPVYKDEQHAKAALRQAVQKQNEAYIAVYIHNKDIIIPKAELTPKDKFGHELLVVNEKAFNKHNVTRFLHISGQYEYDNGKLVYQKPCDFF